MDTKKIVSLGVIMVVVLAGSEFCSGMARRPAKPAQDSEDAGVTLIEGAAQQPSSETVILPERDTRDIKATQTVTILPVELAQDKHIRTRQVQLALTNAGYDPGPIDGKSGVKTISAIKEFQKANNLVVDGKVGPKTWEILSKYYAGE